MKIGVIGGSGLYEMDGFTNVEEVRVRTPFGDPSDAYICGVLNGVETVFLPRHGVGHRILPSELNHRANIYGMKSLGVQRLLSVTAVGSLKKEFAPRDIVVADQFVDRTKRSGEHTFFGEGIVAHVAFSEPVCSDLQRQVYRTALEHMQGLPDGPAGRPPTTHMGGTYLNMEGPAFSTKAESHLYRSWGMDIIGMTCLAEAKLAREAELCFATMAMVTDYDCWHEEHAAVSVEMVVQTVRQNSEMAQNIIRAVVPKLTGETDCACGSALENAVITSPDAFPQDTRERLDLLIGRYF